MAKKKTTKKKTTVRKAKTIELHTEFDLGTINTETRKLYAAYLTEMLSTNGWRLMETILKSNLAVIEKAIITKMDPVTNKVMTDQEVDEYRIQHTQLDTLLKKPAELVAQFAGAEKVGVVFSYDPYQQAIRKDTSVPASSLSETT